MNAIRFAVYTGILWTIASVLLIEISIIQGAPTAWVELDFRLLSGTVLIILNSLDLGTNLSELIQYAQFGMPVNALNTITSLITGFIDGFTSGFFIAIFYNFLSIISEGKNFPTTIKFGIATGIVLGICSGLLAIVSIQYNFEMNSFGFAIRPMFLTFLGISNIAQITDGSFLSTVSKSYLIFPDGYGSTFEWGLWGFVDGFIGGVILALTFTRIRNYYRR